MTREELLEKICYSNYTLDCCSFDGRYDCQDCKDAINPLLDEYDKQIRADAIEEVEQIIHNIYTGNLYCVEDMCEKCGMGCDDCLYTAISNSLHHLKQTEDGGKE